MCHFQVRANFSKLRLEQNHGRPSTLEELKREITTEFFTTNEKAAARIRLMDLNLKDFKDLQ